MNSNGTYNVSDRVNSYNRDELQKVDTERLQTNPDQDNYEESQQIVKHHDTACRVTRRINKEGLDDKNIIKDINRCQYFFS